MKIYGADASAIFTGMPQRFKAASLWGAYRAAEGNRDLCPGWCLCRRRTTSLFPGPLPYVTTLT